MSAMDEDTSQALLEHTNWLVYKDLPREECDAQSSQAAIQRNQLEATMGLTVRDNGSGDFELAPEGTHLARCWRVVDLGTQYSERWGKSKPQVLINWELSDEHMSDGRPFNVGKKYTASLSEKSNLRKDLEAWRGRKFTDEELEGFDISKLLGACCYLGVTHNETNGKTYANVSSVMALPKGASKPDPSNEPVLFDIDNWDEAVFQSLSEGLQNLIRQSEEYKAKTGQGPAVHNSQFDPQDPGANPDQAPEDSLEDIPF